MKSKDKLIDIIYELMDIIEEHQYEDPDYISDVQVTIMEIMEGNDDENF